MFISLLFRNIYIYNVITCGVYFSALPEKNGRIFFLNIKDKRVKNLPQTLNQVLLARHVNGVRCAYIDGNGKLMNEE